MDDIQALAAAIERDRIERARRMSPEEKFFAGVQLFEHSCRLMADGVRHQFPEADEAQVAAIVRQRLDLARWLETHP